MVLQSVMRRKKKPTASRDISWGRCAFSELNPSVNCGRVDMNRTVVILRTGCLFCALVFSALVGLVVNWPLMWFELMFELAVGTEIISSVPCAPL